MEQCFSVIQVPLIPEKEIAQSRHCYAFYKLLTFTAVRTGVLGSVQKMFCLFACLKKYLIRK